MLDKIYVAVSKRTHKKLQNEKMEVLNNIYKEEERFSYAIP